MEVCLSEDLKIQSSFGFLGEMKPLDLQKTLRERYVIPPFSVLDARQGYWQERKSKWLELGIQSEIGRGGNALDISATDAIAVGYITEEQRDEWNAGRRERLTWVGGDREDLDETSNKILGSGRKTDKLAPGGTGKNSAWKYKTENGYQTRKDLENLTEEQKKGLGCYLATGETIAKCGSVKAYNADYNEKKEPEYGTAKTSNTEDIYSKDGKFLEEGKGGGITGTSIFDPVLCELLYK